MMKTYEEMRMRTAEEMGLTDADIAAMKPGEIIMMPPPPVDIGVSIADAQSIKQMILSGVCAGNIDPNDVAGLATDIVAAFKDIDNNVFARDAMTRELEAAQKKSLTQQAKVS
jgi:hypothetical protein